MIAPGTLQERLGIASERLSVLDEALLLGVVLLLEIEQGTSGPTRILKNASLMDLPRLLKPERPLLSVQLERVFKGLADIPLALLLEGVAVELLQNHHSWEWRYEATRMYGEALDRIPSDQEYVTISEPVARMIAGTLSTFEGMRVLDPACGSGRLLSAVGLSMRSQGIEKFSLQGVEHRPLHAALAELNMMLHGFVDAKIQSEPTRESDGDFFDIGFDAVVCVPPRGQLRDPSRTPDAQFIFRIDKHRSSQSQGMAYLDHSLRQLNWQEKSRLTFLLPAGILFRRGMQIMFRERLTEAGMMTAAVSFPAGLVRDLQIPFAMLVLDTRGSWPTPLPPPPVEPVRLVDASPTRTRTTRTAEPLAGGGVEAVLGTLEWRQSLPMVDVSLDDLRANEYIWQASRYLNQHKEVERPSPETPPGESEVPQVHKSIQERFAAADLRLEEAQMNAHVAMDRLLQVLKRQENGA